MNFSHSRSYTLVKILSCLEVVLKQQAEKKIIQIHKCQSGFLFVLKVPSEVILYYTKSDVAVVDSRVCQPCC